MDNPHRKKPKTTTSQTSSRHTTHEAPKQHVSQHNEELLNNFNDADDINSDADAETGASQDASISQGIPQLPKMLADMFDARRTRTAASKRVVYTAYDTTHTTLTTAITTHFDAHDARAAEVHVAHLARLQDLLKRKTAIEDAMAKKLVELREEYVWCSKALEMIVEYRMAQRK